MNSQRMFLILLLLNITLYGSWYLFIYQSREIENQQAQAAVEEMQHKLQSANMALQTLDSLKIKINRENKELTEMKSKIIYGFTLPQFTNQLKKNVKDFRLELKQFNPAVESYLQDSLQASIKPLSFTVSITGSFLNTGKFLENWKSLPFFLVPDAVEMQRVKSGGNSLQTKIIGHVYVWNNN